MKHNDVIDSMIYAQKCLISKREISWIEGIKRLIDGKMVKVMHGCSEYIYRKTSNGEFKLFDMRTYTFKEQYLDADDITEGKWFIVED